MENMKIRPAERADLEEILKIYAYAREFMVRSGNPTQWVNGYPERTMLEEDIHKGNLYAVLREFDEEDVDVIYSESFSQGSMGNAIMNRLLKAAAHRVITVGEKEE